MRAFFISCGALLAGIFLLLAPLYASAATGLTIQPVKVDQTIPAGDSLSDKILLTNASDGAIDVSVSVEDFVPVAGAESFQFVDRAPGVTSVRDWITIGSAPSFTLKEGEAKEIPYSISTPLDAEPGGHFGVVFFKATPLGGSPGSLKVGTQVGMLVLVSIPGNHLQKGNILDFSAPAFLQGGPVPLSIKFQNTGTVHFEPKGSIVISNLFGAKVAELPILGQVVLPTSVKTLQFSWDAAPFAIGRYSAVATVYDGEGIALTSKEASFWILPLWYIGGFIVVLILIYLLLRYIKRHVRVSLK